MTGALICAAGGLGAVLRFVVDGMVARRLPDRVALGTWLVNVTGSALLGATAGWVSAHGDSAASAAWGTGLLGGYTTFSTASVEAMRLVREGRAVIAATHALSMLIVSVLAAAAGWALMR